MSKCFREGLVYVVTTKKIKKSFRKRRWSYEESKKWIKKINGRKVVILNSQDGCIGIYNVGPEWCKCIGRENDYESDRNS